MARASSSSSAPAGRRRGAPFSSAKHSGSTQKQQQQLTSSRSARSRTRGTGAANAEDRDFEAANVFDATQSTGRRKKDASSARSLAAAGTDAAAGSRYTLSREEAALAGYRRPGQHRQVTELDDDDLGEAGDDDEEDSEDRAMAARIRRAALAIAGDSPLELADEDESEEVDSDEAWDGSDGEDEARWGGTFASLRKANNKRGKAGEQARQQARQQRLDVDLDESDDGESKQAASVKPPKRAINSPQEDLEEDEDDDDEDTAEEDDDDESAASDPELPSSDGDSGDSDDDNDDDNLASFVANLPSAAAPSTTKRKPAADDNGDDVAPKKRRVLPSRPGFGGREDGGEYGVAPSTSSAANNAHHALSLDALLSVDPSLKSTAAALTATSNSSSSVLRSGTLAAPLPLVVSERLAREAAYDATKGEADKWGGVMKRVKEAEHLRFPLQAGGAAGVAGTVSQGERRRGGVNSSGDLIGGFKPTSELESAVDRLLSAANLGEQSLEAAERDALESADLTIEEVAARRAELRHRRELLFREEARAKRVAKIKSKTYRKLARKRRAAAGEVDMEELARLDPEAAEAEAIKLEAARAKERATLKHSSKTGRWAAAQHGAGETDDKRRELNEMLARKEKLTRRIQGRGSGSDASDADDNDDDDLSDVEAAALQQLDEENPTPASPPKGLMGMKFMQRAMARQKNAVDEQEAELRRQLEGYAESEASEEEEPTKVHVGGNAGRMVFAAGQRAAPVESTAPAVANDSSDDEQEREPTATATVADSSNPWLSGEVSGARARKHNVAATATAADKAQRQIAKVKSKKADGAADDARVDLDLSAPATRKKKAKALEASDDDDDDDDDAAEINGLQAFKQRDLVAQAFAGDNVVEDFAAEKQRAIEADAPREEDVTLAGWGSWGGKGVRKNKKQAARKFVKSIPGIDASARKDAGKSNVIISERKDKKASKYLATDLPYPFTSAAQYEASFADPVGAEWNTRAVHQRAVMPRVTKKPGAIIEPVRRLF